MKAPLSVRSDGQHALAMSRPFAPPRYRHWGDYLEANWQRSRALMQRGRFTPLPRELIATAVSIANACRY